MKYLRQFSWILAVTCMGEILKFFLSFPVPENKIRQIKQEFITDRVKQSVAMWGMKHKLLSGFITTATMCLALFISEVLKAAREVKNRLFQENLEKEYGRKINFTREIYGESDIEEHTENAVHESASDSKDEIIQYTEPAFIPSPANTMIKEIPKPQIPPKPVMSPLAAFYPKYKKIKAELDRMNRQIASKEEEISIRKTGFTNTVRNHGFASVKDFYDTLYASKEAYNEYLLEERAWEEIYDKKASKAETLTERLQRHQKEAMRLLRRSRFVMLWFKRCISYSVS